MQLDQRLDPKQRHGHRKLAFNQSSLTSIVIGSNVTNIGDLAFSSCFFLTDITVDTLNSAYSSVGGVLLNNDQTTLIQYPGGRTGDYTIPNTSPALGVGHLLESVSTALRCRTPLPTSQPGAFAECYNLTSVAIPNSVRSIGDYAFSSCTSLSNITIGNGVSNVGNWAFFNCTSLTSVVIPGSVRGIGNIRSKNASSLNSITIPIGSRASELLRSIPVPA